MNLPALVDSPVPFIFGIGDIVYLTYPLPLLCRVGFPNRGAGTVTAIGTWITVDWLDGTSLVNPAYLRKG